jgi:hypothetical protein
MALEQPNNQPQPMAQRPPVSDEGGAMPNQGDAMPNQQAQGQAQGQGQDQGQNQEQQIQEFQQRVQQLSPQEKQVLSQSLTPEFKDITIKVFGSEISIFFDVLESGIEEMQPTAQPMPQPQPAMAQGGGEGFANRPPEQPQGGGMVQRPQPV